MNIPTIIAIVAVAAAVILAVRQIIRNRSEGKSCAGCPYRDGCSGKSNRVDCTYRVDNSKEEW